MAVFASYKSHTKGTVGFYILLKDWVIVLNEQPKLRVVQPLLNYLIPKYTTTEAFEAETHYGVVISVARSSFVEWILPYKANESRETTFLATITYLRVCGFWA